MLELSSTAFLRAVEEARRGRREGGGSTQALQRAHLNLPLWARPAEKGVKGERYAPQEGPVHRTMVAAGVEGGV